MQLPGKRMSTSRTARVRLPFPFLPVLLCLLLVHSAAVAAPVEPPLDLLLSGTSRLVSGKVVEIDPAGRIVFARGHVLSKNSDVPEMIDVRVSPSVVESVALGDEYLFAYSMTHRDKLAPAGVSLNRQGAILISSSGVEPALFRNSAELRSILEVAGSDRGPENRHLLELLLKTLDGNDAKMRALVAAQIALDPTLGDGLKVPDRKGIERVARSSKTDPSTRILLLQAATERPEQFGDWWQAAAEEVLETTPLGGYALESWNATSLVLLAFDLFNIREVLAPRELLARWLRSPNRLLIERSNAALGRGYPTQQRGAIEEALADQSLTRETRNYLDDQLHRLDGKESGRASQ